MFNPNCPTLALLQQLIACPSVTPEDAGCQAILGERLKKMGFVLKALPSGDVQNLWAIRGNQSPLFVFAGHTDVVPAGDLNQWKTPPFTPSIQGDYLYGRGAADMKGGLAAMIIACERFVAKNPQHPGSIAFLITSDEEGPAIHGTVKILEYLKTQGIHMDYCLIGEPTSDQKVGDILKNGRRGSLNGNLKILGKQGHVAYPMAADNPIHRVLLSLAKLVDTQWDKEDREDLDFPPTTFQISNIHSGTGATNVIPGILECQFNFRFGTATTPEALMAGVEAVLKQEGVSYEVSWKLSGAPFLTKSGILLPACIQAIRDCTQIEARPSTDGGTSDGRFIAPTGTEVIELGLCNASIHAANECIKIADLHTLSQIYERILDLTTSSRT
jgi:succinyl-diaminopimelate desuccinylase